MSLAAAVRQAEGMGQEIVVADDSVEAIVAEESLEGKYLVKFSQDNGVRALCSEMLIDGRLERQCEENTPAGAAKRSAVAYAGLTSCFSVASSVVISSVTGTPEPLLLALSLLISAPIAAVAGAYFGRARRVREINDTREELANKRQAISVVREKLFCTAYSPEDIVLVYADDGPALIYGSEVKNEDVISVMCVGEPVSDVEGLDATLTVVSMSATEVLKPGFATYRNGHIQFGNRRHQLLLKGHPQVLKNEFKLRYLQPKRAGDGPYR